MSDNKIQLKIFQSESLLAEGIYKRIKNIIQKNEKASRKTVICFPTGNSPLKAYERIVKGCNDGEISLKNVVAISPGEYYPIEKTNPNSCFSYLHKHLFSKTDILEENINIPRGDLKSIDEYDSYCENYEEFLNDQDNIDLTILGIGKTGHIAFNEPGSSIRDLTRISVLHEKTRGDILKSKFFKCESIDDVPKNAVTIGIGTILNKSREILLVASGYHKAKIIQKVVEGNLGKYENPSPACFLRMHSNCSFFVDVAAGYQTKQITSPWCVVSGTSAIRYKWIWEDSIPKAVIWLSKRVKKPILALSEKDFHDNSLSSLFYAVDGKIEKVCERVYHMVYERIHSERNILLPVSSDRVVVVFSPHPDDDVISMGGTMATISVLHGNKNVYVGYLTDGSRGISKSDLTKHLKFTFSTLPILGIKESKEIKEKVETALGETKDYQLDTPFIQSLKKNIRKAEAINALDVLELPESRAKFLELPFYQTGKDEKSEPTEKDIDIVFNMLMELQATDLVVCFDLEDPHGTHSHCYWICKAAIEKYEKEIGKKKEIKKYLYKGAWQEFNIHQCDILIPMNQRVLDLKMDSIFQHGSQKDKPMFPGDDKRQFHERAMERNCQTAKELKDLGLPGFFACEGLKIVDELPNSITI